MSTPNERRKLARKAARKQRRCSKRTAYGVDRPLTPYLAPFGIPVFGYGVPGREA